MHTIRPILQEGAESGLRKAFEKTVPLGQRLDILFHQIRLGFFFMDHDLVTRNLQKAKRYRIRSGTMSPVCSHVVRVVHLPILYAQMYVYTSVS